MQRMKWIQRTAKVKPSKSDDIIDKLAKIRGIKDIDRFLNPTQDELHNPYLMRNIEDASNRIIRAIKNGERICLSYDADADGITATTVMYRYLRNYTENVYYIYSERNDGHGIQNQIDQIENGTDLLIIIDSSSNEVEACKKISESGAEIIILDHHAIEVENPHVLLVNPQHYDCDYPNNQLSGAGVVFKTIQVMEDTLGQVDPFDYLDLVAVGMYADIMRIDVLENRFMIMYGLRNIKNTGLIRILKGAKIDLFKVNCDSIGFGIAPLLNGVARMDNIKLAIDILLEDDDAKCKPIRLKMQKLNESRKEKQKEIVNQYLKNVDSSQKVLIVLDEQSSKGFNGIVAQQLAEKYKRPVVVGRLHKGTISGSFRSYNGFKFKSFLQEFGGDIEALGHEGAGGIVLAEENLPDLMKYIDVNMPTLGEREPTVVYDIEMHVDDIGEYIRVVEQFNHLVGNGFPKIIVKVDGIMVDNAECIGKTMETVKIRTFDSLELIKFRVNDQYASELGTFDRISVVGVLSMNEWYNFKTKEKISTPQVMIEDYMVMVEED